LTKSLDFSRFSSILGVKNDLKGIAPSRSFENIKFYRWLKIGVAQKHFVFRGKAHFNQRGKNHFPSYTHSITIKLEFY